MIEGANSPAASRIAASSTETVHHGVPGLAWSKCEHGWHMLHAKKPERFSRVLDAFLAHGAATTEWPYVRYNGAGSPSCGGVMTRVGPCGVSI